MVSEKVNQIDEYIKKIDRCTTLGTIKIPVLITEMDGKFVFKTDDEGEKIFGGPIISQGNSIEEATAAFIRIAKVYSRWMNERSQTLDRLHPFQTGPWSRNAGRWVSIYGINIQFRVGKGMKYGFYIPFTKLNIRFTNHWKKPIKK